MKSETQTTINFAILPLQNLSDDTTIEMFSNGMVMDLITDLSRFRSFNIISYDTIKTIRPDKNSDSQELNDMHLDYLIKGMVRFHNNLLSFNLQLVNAQQNRLVWAEKFSGSLDEIFQMQEQMVEKIVVSLQQFVDYDLLTEIRKKPLANLNAYECWLRGVKEIKKGTLEADEQARTYFRKAMENSPHYARAYTGMSLSYFNEWSCQIWDRWEVSQKGAFEWAQKAVELDEQDHISTAILGRVYLFNGEYDKAEHYLRKALRLNYNDADHLIMISTGLTFLGHPKEAYQLYEKAMHLNPSGDDDYFVCGAFAKFEMGDFDASIALAEKHQLGKGWIDFSAFMAAACYHKGEYERAKELWNYFLGEFTAKINKGKPASTQMALQWMMDVNPFKNKSNIKPFWEYLAQHEGDLQPSQKQRKDKYTSSINIEGNLWTFSFGGQQTQLPELKGFHDLARLLSTPYNAIHCTDLAGTQLVEAGQEIIDEKAKQNYRQRILEVQEELQEAESTIQPEKVAKLQEEYDELIEHLSKATGLGGQSRKTSGSVEKARTSVTWRIRKAIDRIAESHPSLGKHLKASVKTGMYCEYSPEIETTWIQ